VDAQQRQRDRFSSGVVRHVGRAKVKEGEKVKDAKANKDSVARLRAMCLPSDGVGMLGSWGLTEGPIGGRRCSRMRTVRRCSKAKPDRHSSELESVDAAGSEDDNVVALNDYGRPLGPLSSGKR